MKKINVEFIVYGLILPLAVIGLGIYLIITIVPYTANEVLIVTTAFAAGIAFGFILGYALRKKIEKKIKK